MRVLVDATCAEFGGIRTYAEHLLQAWPREFAHDEIHVLLRSDSDLPLDARLHRHDVRIPRPAALGRPWAQTRAIRRLVRDLEVDAVLAMHPATTVNKPPVPTAVVIYDLRHELRPEQFTRKVRALRAISYRRGYSIADGIVSISQRSLDDLTALHPRMSRVPATVAHLGADHVDDWSGALDMGPAITFAHHTNKNLNLVLAGWQLLIAHRPDARLRVLGLGSKARADAAERVRELGLEHHVQLAPFLPDHEFQQVFAEAAVIVFPSDFEGFGLPVAEGLRLGIPVVIGPERATAEVAAGRAEIMTDWTAVSLSEAVEKALAWPAERRAEARRYAERFTWAATAHETRTFLTRLTGRPGM